MAGAVFTAEIDGEERLVVVQEVERAQLRHLNMAEIGKAIRAAVTQIHDVQVQAIYLLRPMTIPKTSSGKLQRQRCRQLLLAHELEVVAEWTSSATRKALCTGAEREAVDTWPSMNLPLVTLPAA